MQSRGKLSRRRTLKKKSTRRSAKQTLRARRIPKKNKRTLKTKRNPRPRRTLPESDEESDDEE